jgi:phage terminase large subunit GpA-like protein
MIADSKILILTAGVDLQSDRAEVTIVGWGEGDEAWVLGHYRVYGDPHGGLFNQVDGILRKRFRHASGHWMHAERVLVDSGNDSKNVYDYVFRCAPRKVFASKGTRGYSPVFVKQSEGQNRRLFIIKIDTPKQNLYNRLRLDSPGIGYVHLPSNPSSGVDLAYCKQLVSETMRWQYTRGQRIPYFELPSGAKNESLDCFVYSMAARQLEDIDVPSVRAWLDSPPDADCDWLARSGTDDTTAVNEAASEPSDLNDALAHLDRVLEKINLK